jgi:hypothetical protein
VTAEPQIFTKNYFDSCDENAPSRLTVNYGNASKAYLYDRDKDSKWLTSGANSDLTTVSIQVDFYERGQAVSRTIDRLIILNHNWKNFIVYYWDGAAWQTWSTQTNVADANTIISLASQTTAKIKVEITATQSADAEKYAGELMACAAQITAFTNVAGGDAEMAVYKPKYRERSQETIFGDGGLYKSTNFWTPNRSQRYEARVGWKYLATSVRNTLLTIKQSGEPFLWRPESVNRPDEIFLCRWSSPFEEDYSSLYKSAGLDIDAVFKEV